MKLSEVVAKFGFTKSDMASIKDAFLFERDVNGLLSEFLCIQKIGDIMRVDRAVVAIQPGFIQQIGTPVNKLIHKTGLEEYLNLTLAPVNQPFY